MKHTCPVCWQHAHQTTNTTIKPHRDNAGTMCPASGQPYRITRNNLEGAA